MTTTRVSATALPYSLAADAPFHASVFFTHRLEPEAADATLADFPGTRDWVTTLRSGTLELVTDQGADPILVRWVSTPSEANWRRIFPPDTPVAGFAPPPSEATDGPWTTYPAHSMERHAIDVHLASTLVSPMTPPRVQHNAVVDSVLSELRPHQPAIDDLLSAADSTYRQRERLNLTRKFAETAASLGIDLAQRSTNGAGGTIEWPAGVVEAVAAITRFGYVVEPASWTSAVEMLLADREGERAVTDYLDQLVDGEAVDVSPTLRTLIDVHAARRFFQREQTDYRERPDEGTTPQPEDHPQVPEQDFH